MENNKEQERIEFKDGDKVHYTSPHGSKENGIVKSTNDSGTIAWVVYNCDGEWDMYFKYTGAATNVQDLTHGWINTTYIKQ